MTGGDFYSYLNVEIQEFEGWVETRGFLVR